MRPLVFVLFATALCATPVPAQQADGKKELTTQQQRMQQCNAEAKKRQLKERERQQFMSSCLKGEQLPVVKKGAPPQERMAACNKEASAKGMTGDDRKKFMSECLKG
jgi:psiF repeat